MSDFFKQTAEADINRYGRERTDEEIRRECALSGYERRVSALDRLDQEINAMTDVKGEAEMRRLARLCRLRDGIREDHELRRKAGR